MRLRPVVPDRSYAQRVDLSGIIFVVLAIGWAAYLLPMALRHHDEADQSRPVEEFSGSLRVLGQAVARKAAARPQSSSVEPAETTAARSISREAARNAAARRRRVLALLLTLLVGVTISSSLSYTPWFATAFPGVLIVAFLVVARLTVRAQQVRLVTHSSAAAIVEVGEVTETRLEVELDLGIEDTEGLSREELAQAIGAPEMDDGGLWDPLPVTLPTYVTKARARRTVRTVELTAGITSSGHDAGDSALAREAAEIDTAAAPQVEPEERTAAGA